jgi:hypothetical protein
VHALLLGPGRNCPNHQAVGVRLKKAFWLRVRSGIAYMVSNTVTNQKCPFQNPTARLAESPTGSRYSSEYTLGFEVMIVTSEQITESTDMLSGFYQAQPS